MITNRSSYLLGAALGSALMLAVCAPANAADIYEGGLKGGYDVPPPPPTDRGIYFKGYVGQANPDVGGIWTESSMTNGISPCTTRTSSRARCSASASAGRRSHWLRFDLTGEYRGDALFVGAATRPDVGLRARTSTRPTSAAGWVSPTPTSTWATGAASRRYIGAGIGFATLTVDGMKDVNARQVDPSVGYGATKTNDQLRLRLLRRCAASTSRRRWRSISPTATPTSARRRAAA